MPLHSHSARNAGSSLVFSFQDLNSNPIGSPDTAGGRVSLSPKDIHGWMRGADISPSVTTFSLALEEVLPPLAVTSDPRPFNQQLPEPPDPRCVLEPQDNPEVAPAPVCALCCCFGIIYCCFGYRCFKTVIFLSGLLSGASYCATSWVLLGIWPALGALGALAQWKLMPGEHGGHTSGELVLWYRSKVMPEEHGGHTNGLFLVSQMHKGRHIPPLGSKATMGGRENMGACE
nr:PREDICTED: uncharacterized protein LOC107126713 isoform X1 [Macaca fascicularis]